MRALCVTREVGLRACVVLCRAWDSGQRPTSTTTPPMPHAHPPTRRATPATGCTREAHVHVTCVRECCALCVWVWRVWVPTLQLADVVFATQLP